MGQWTLNFKAVRPTEETPKPKSSGKEYPSLCLLTGNCEIRCAGTMNIEVRRRMWGGTYRSYVLTKQSPVRVTANISTGK